MKFKSLYSLLLIITVSVVNGQTDESNQEKYWKFRNTFKENFIKIGPQQGESLPAVSIGPGKCVDTYDVAQDGDSWGQTFYSNMHWGDGTIYQGHYLGFLATEYALLKNNNGDLKGVLNELYYAILALDRLDLSAEPVLSELYDYTYFDFFSENHNGFYLRDDVPQNFNNYWLDEPWKVGCVSADGFRSNNTAGIDDPGNGLVIKEDDYLNAPSLDQMTSLFVGFRVIKKLVDNVFVKPTDNDAGFYIVDKIQEIAFNMINYAAERNWMIIDVNGWPVANGGGDLILTAYPLLIGLAKILDQPVADVFDMFDLSFKRKLIRQDKIQQCITGKGSTNDDPIEQQAACNDINNIALLNNHISFLSNGVPAGLGNNQNFSVYQNWLTASVGLTVNTVSGNVDEFGLIWHNNFVNQPEATIQDWEEDHKFSFLPFPLNKITFDIEHHKNHNLTLTYNCGVISGLWTNSTTNVWSYITENRQLELINALLNDQLPYETKDFYQDFLDGMPFSGPYFLYGQAWPGTGIKDSLYAQNGWASVYRWTNALYNDGGGANKISGIYNALDYMYFHNLYYLIYQNQLPEFKDDFDCVCTNTVQIPNGNTSGEVHDVIENLNKKLEFVPWCNPNVFEPVNNNVSGVFDIKPKFNQYIDLNILPVKHQTADAVINSTGEVNVYTHTVLCGNKTLTVESGSTLNIINGNFILKQVSVLDVFGDVHIGEKGKLDFGSLARVVLHNGARLILDEGAKLVINHGGILEYYNGAQVITDGANSEILLKGVIKMMDGGTFKIDHSSSSESGRFIVDVFSGSCFIKNSQTSNFAQVILNGKDENDEFLIIKENSKLYVDDYFNPVTIDRLRIHSCKVELKENALIEVRQQFRTNNATYFSAVDNAGLILTDDNNIVNCTFNDVPIYADLFEGYKLRLSYSTLNSTGQINDSEHEALLKITHESGYDINNCDFIGSREYGILALGTEFPSKVKNSTFTFHDPNEIYMAFTGIKDVSTTELTLEQNTFDYCYRGVSKQFGKLNLKCNYFNGITFFNIHGEFGSTINMSTYDFAGYNNFNSPNLTHVALTHSNFNIKSGRNKFENGATKYIEGTLLSNCPQDLNCSINATRNQWSSTLAAPAQNLFDVTDDNGFQFPVATIPTESFPPCGYYDNNGNITNSSGAGQGQSEFGMSQGNGNNSNNGVALSQLPFVTTFFNPNIRLDKAVKHGVEKMKIHDSLGNDGYAIEVFNDIFNNNLSKHNPFIKEWLNLSLSSMKSAIENAIYDDLISPQNNQAIFDNYVQMYVDALNYMSDSLIESENYREQFYLELDKAHLYRVLDMPQKGSEVLANVDNCGLDTEEQIVLNYWKKQYKIFELRKELGSSYRDTTIIIDTSSYKSPSLYMDQQYYFGSRINGVNDIEYRICSEGSSQFITFDGGNGASRKYFELYPNPGFDDVTLTYSGDYHEGDLLIKFFGPDGRLIEEVRLIDFKNKESFSISNWASGAYIYKIESIHGSYNETGRFFVK